MKRVVASLFGVVAGLSPAIAAPPLNVPVAARVLAFVQPPLSGPLQAVIVFEPGDAESEAEAAAIDQQIGTGSPRGRAAIRVRRVPVSALAGLSGIRVAFVTGGIREQVQLAAFATRSATLTITSDLGCVQAGHCVLAISGTQRTQITISRMAAQASRIRFGSAFLMLVKEV